jgi:hypothetical protein
MLLNCLVLITETKFVLCEVGNEILRLVAGVSPRMPRFEHRRVHLRFVFD